MRYSSTLALRAKSPHNSRAKSRGTIFRPRLHSTNYPPVQFVPGWGVLCFEIDLQTLTVLVIFGTNRKLLEQSETLWKDLELFVTCYEFLEIRVSVSTTCFRWKMLEMLGIFYIALLFIYTCFLFVLYFFNVLFLSSNVSLIIDMYRSWLILVDWGLDGLHWHELTRLRMA